MHKARILGYRRRMISTSLHAPVRVFRSFVFTLLGLIPVAQAAEIPIPARSELPHLAMEGVPPPDVQLAARLSRYQHSRQANFLDWLPQGGLLISTRFDEQPQVHRVAGAGADREQLTFVSESVLEARALGGKGAFVFLAEGPGHLVQVYYCAGTPGSVKLLTPGRATHEGLVPSHDGRYVAFAGNERAAAERDVYVADVNSTVAPKLLTALPGVWQPLDWSADDQRLLVLKTVSATQSALYVAEISSGALTPLVTAPAAVHRSQVRAARFAPDGKGIYLISDEAGEQLQLRYFDLASHQERAVSPQLSWDVEDFDVSSDGRHVAYVVNDDGISRLLMQDTVSHLDLSLPAIPQGTISHVKFDAAGRRLAFTLETAQQPRDVYVYTLGQPALERWTHSETGPIDAARLVSAELVHYPTWDRVGGRARTLSAYLYRPQGNGPFPVLIALHGGPQEQARPGWDPFYQFLVNELGYAVIAPNVRGSGGYGRSFAALDDGMLRQDAVRDVGSLLVWLGLQPIFDRQHIAVMGDAYGGYMALASLASYSDRLCGGIDVLGINNFVTYLGAQPENLREQGRAEFGDERDPRVRAFLERISPLHNVTQIRQPVLMVQGVSDPKVPGEAQQMAWRLRSRGDEVWYVAAKDEGAWARSGGRDAYLGTAALFLRRLLGGNVTATANP